MSKANAAPSALTPSIVRSILEAYDRALIELVYRGINPTERVRASLARTIIELAEHGNHSAGRLKTAALARFKPRR